MFDSKLRHARRECFPFPWKHSRQEKFRTGGKLGIANASTWRMTFENLESLSRETEFVAREIIADTIGGQSHVSKHCNQ